VRDASVGAKFTVSSPLEIAGVDKVEPRRAPRVGEHSVEILGQLGFSAGDIEQLVSGRTVAADGGQA